MDVFIEKIVKKKATGIDIAINILLAVAAIILFLVVFLFLGALGFLLGCLEVYGVWYLISSRSLEYEYSLTNGELDVDCIIAQRKRKRLASLDCREVEIFAPVNENYKRELESSGIKNKIFAVSSPNSEGQYFCIFNDKNNGRTLLVFEPDDRMINSFKSYAPRKAMDK